MVSCFTNVYLFSITLTYYTTVSIIEETTKSIGQFAIFISPPTGFFNFNYFHQIQTFALIQWMQNPRYYLHPASDCWRQSVRQNHHLFYYWIMILCVCSETRPPGNVLLDQDRQHYNLRNWFDKCHIIVLNRNNHSVYKLHPKCYQ